MENPNSAAAGFDAVVVVKVGIDHTLVGVDFAVVVTQSYPICCFPYLALLKW